MAIQRGSDIEALLMLCALADPKDAKEWLYRYDHAPVCPISSAANTVAGMPLFSFYPYKPAEFLGCPDNARTKVVMAADNLLCALPGIRAALEAMFPE